MSKFIGIYVPAGKPHKCHVVCGDDAEAVARRLKGRVLMESPGDDRKSTLGVWSTDVTVALRCYQSGGFDGETFDGHMVKGHVAVMETSQITFDPGIETEGD